MERKLCSLEKREIDTKDIVRNIHYFRFFICLKMSHIYIPHFNKNVPIFRNLYYT